LKLPERLRIHISLLTKTENPTFDKDEVENEYEVEEILGKQVRNGVTVCT